MSEPENLILQHLRDIRGRLDGMEQKLEARIDRLENELGGRMDHLKLKLDGLTHAVIAGFGSLVHEIDGVKDRVQRLEREKA